MSVPSPDASRSGPASNGRNLWTDLRTLAPAERGLWRHPLMWASAVAITAVPVLYATVYLSSAWDPYGDLKRLPVAVVNLDRGTVRDGKTYNVGGEALKHLREDPPVRLVDYRSEAGAQAAVRAGQVYFALTFPADFSRRAVNGASSEHGLLHLYTAEGTSFFASRVGQSVAKTITVNINASLGTNRWEVVQTRLGEVQQGFRDMKKAVGQLRDGAVNLSDGAGRLASGAASLTDGTAEVARGARALSGGADKLASGVNRSAVGTVKLSDALRRLEAAAPGETQLAPLRKGTAQLAQGAGKLAGGLDQLSAGAQKLGSGAGQLAAGAAKVNAGTGRLAVQAPKLAEGLGQLQAGASASRPGPGSWPKGQARSRRARRNWRPERQTSPRA